MSTAAPPRPPKPPVAEEDLQRLYNDVLAGFGEESPVSERHPATVLASNEHDLASLYSSYAGDDDSGDSSRYNRSSPISPASASTPGGLAASPRDSGRPSSNTKSSPQSNRPRPLPRLPGALSPTVGSSPVTEPPYYPYSKHDSTDSYVSQSNSTDLRRKVTSSSISNRRGLPPSPLPNGVQNGNASTGSLPPSRAMGSNSKGLPSGVRPSYSRDTSSLSGSGTDSPISASSPHSGQNYAMPTPEFTGWNAQAGSAQDSNGATVGKAQSLRPPGASPPQIPGYNSGYDGRVDLASSGLPSPSGGFYSNNNGSNASESSNRFTGRNGSYRAMESSSGVYSPTHAPSPSLGSNIVNAPQRSSSYGSHMRISSEDVQGSSSYFGSSHGQSTHYNNTDPRIGRTTSTGSTTSSVQSPLLNRNTSTVSGITYDDTAVLGPTSSAATSVNRGDSKRSRNTVSSDGLMYASGDASYSQQRPLYQGFGDSSGYDMPESSKGPTNAEYDHIATIKGPLGLHYGLDAHDEYGPDDDFDGDYSELGDDEFANFSLLSHIAVRLRDKVPRGTHVKGSIPYPRAFTGKDIVSTIQSQIQRDLLINHGVSTSDRRAALQVARSLQSQLFFYEVEWGGRVLQDGVEDVYMFLDDQEGGSELHPHSEREELPTGVITALTKCYSPSCGEGEPCYSWACPFRKENSVMGPAPPVVEPERGTRQEWPNTVEKEVLERLPSTEIRRQTIIHKVISKEEDYVQDLDTVESLFIRPLRKSKVISSSKLEEFIEDVFGNILDLRQCNRNLLEELYVRQREQAPVIQRIGDVFLEAATQFRWAYPIYIGHLPLAEKRLKEEIEENAEFRLFLEDCYRQMAKNQQTRCLNLKHFLTRPTEHLQKYPVLLEAVFHVTAEGNPDTDYLMEAVQAIKNLQTVAQLRTFQCAMGKGPTEKWEWHDLVSKEERLALNKAEAKRQSVIFELIKGEMEYVKDLESIQTMYVQQLRDMDPPIIPRDRLESFIRDVFHNLQGIHTHHRRLLDKFHEIQREEHPIIRSITAPMFDAALNFREAYMEYVPNYPIAAYRIDDEMANNPAFKSFVEDCRRLPDSRRLDMKSFINRPIPRLLRYELLLKGILDETPPGHEDLDAIPQVLDVIKALGKETEPGVVSSKQKVELWRYNSNLVFKPGETIDMDLLDENRSLIHTGKLYRQPDTNFDLKWSELFVILFDNYLVMTKAKERDGVTKFLVNRRPIPLDLLTLANFTDSPTQRGTGIIPGILRGGEKEKHPDQFSQNLQGSTSTPESATDSRGVYPCTIHHNGRLGGLYTLYADTAQARAEWKQKLEEAIGLRKAVQENNKVFEIETLSADTFLVPSLLAGALTPSWNQENSFTGKVTCSVPFTTSDGRGLVAIGCAEGVWIGFRHDSRSMRRVLHLKMVTQCAMLADFGIFLVLADKSLFAYHIEALVPSAPQPAHITQPQKLNGTKDVHFFSVGSLHGRTLVIYMKKKGLDSVFRVLEPVMDKISEKSKAPVSLGSRLGLRTPRSEWFRVYRDFFLPSESFDLIFLKAKIAILCTKGFEIMDLTDFKSVTIPQRDDPRLEKLAKRCESCRPIGMFRSNDEEFLLCYDEFGLYVDKHGDPSRALGTIEWEGTADRVALHGKYILLFDSRFIEVRHVETGRLAQIIPGNDVRCIWDGRGLSTSAHNSYDSADDTSQDPRVHGVVNAPETTRPGAGPRAVTQHVFELIPTIPLYVPDSLASPSTAPYFPPSSSPPRSPRLNPAASWRS